MDRDVKIERDNEGSNDDQKAGDSNATCSSGDFGDPGDLDADIKVENLDPSTIQGNNEDRAGSSAHSTPMQDASITRKNGGGFELGSSRALPAGFSIAGPSGLQKSNADIGLGNANNTTTEAAVTTVETTLPPLRSRRGNRRYIPGSTRRLEVHRVETGQGASAATEFDLTPLLPEKPMNPKRQLAVEKLQRTIAQRDAAEERKRKREAEKPLVIECLEARTEDLHKYEKAEIVEESEASRYRVRDLKTLRAPWRQVKREPLKLNEMRFAQFFFETYTREFIQENDTDFPDQFKRLICLLPGYMVSVNKGFVTKQQRPGSKRRPAEKLRTDQVARDLLRMIKHCFHASQYGKPRGGEQAILANRAILYLLQSDSAGVWDLVPFKDDEQWLERHRCDLCLPELLVMSAAADNFSEQVTSSLDNLLRLLVDYRTSKATHICMRTRVSEGQQHPIYEKVLESIRQRYNPHAPDTSYSMRVMEMLRCWMDYMDSAKRLGEAYDAYSGILRKYKDARTESFIASWQSFETALRNVKAAIKTFDNEDMCGTRHIYSAIDNNSLFMAAVYMLDIAMNSDLPMVADTLPFIENVVNDMPSGLFCLHQGRKINRSLSELNKLAEDEDSKMVKHITYSSRGTKYNEGLYPSNRCTTVKEVFNKIAYRLKVLEIVDDMKTWFDKLPEDRSGVLVDDGAMREMINLTRCRDGQKAVAALLSTSYFEMLRDIILMAKRNGGNSDLIRDALELCNIVVANTMDNQFYSTYALGFSAMLTNLDPNIETDNIGVYLDTMLRFQTQVTNDRRELPMLYLNALTTTVEEFLPTNSRIHSVEQTCGVMESRMLETSIVGHSGKVIADAAQTLIKDDGITKLVKLLLDMVKKYHKQWQQGEPLMSKASEGFIQFVYPMLRILRMLEEHARTIPEYDNMQLLMSDTLSECLLLLWSMTTGLNGQLYCEDIVQPLRTDIVQLVNVICTESKYMMISNFLATAHKYIHLRPAFLGLLLAVMPMDKPMSLKKEEEHLVPILIGNYPNIIAEWTNAFSILGYQYDFIEILLCYGSHFEELSLAFCKRMCLLGDRLAEIFGSWIIDFLAEVLKMRKNKEMPIKDKLRDDSDEELEIDEESLVEGFSAMPKASARQARVFSRMLVLFSDEEITRTVAHQIANSSSKNKISFVRRLMLKLATLWDNNEFQLSFQHSALEFVDKVLNCIPWIKDSNMEQNADAPGSSQAVVTPPQEEDDTLYFIISELVRMCNDTKHNTAVLVKVLALIFRELDSGGNGSSQMTLHCLVNIGVNPVFQHMLDTEVKEDILAGVVKICQKVWAIDKVALIPMLILCENHNAFFKLATRLITVPAQTEAMLHALELSRHLYDEDFTETRRTIDRPKLSAQRLLRTSENPPVEVVPSGMIARFKMRKAYTHLFSYRERSDNKDRNRLGSKCRNRGQFVREFIEANTPGATGPPPAKRYRPDVIDLD